MNSNKRRQNYQKLNLKQKQQTENSTCNNVFRHSIIYTASIKDLCKRRLNVVIIYKH